MRAISASFAALLLAALTAGAAIAASPASPVDSTSAPPTGVRATWSDSLPHLPLIEFPVAVDSGQWMAVHLTGDGGLSVTDKGIGRTLAANGIPTVELNTLRYFFKRRTPDRAAQDLTRILRHYLPAWNRQKVVLVGYSMGADVLPFLISRLPEDLRGRVGLVVFIGLAHAADFHIHLRGFLGHPGKDALLVGPELEKLRGIKMVCFYAARDGHSLCRSRPADLGTCTEMSGRHRVGRNYGEITRAILDGTGR